MKLTPEAINEINRLAGRMGTLTPEQVVDAAKDTQSPLHPCFTWDDSEAAEKWRIEEARDLIRSIRIEKSVEERVIRSVAFVHRPSDVNDAGYVSTMKITRHGAEDVMRAEISAVLGHLDRAVNIADIKAAALPGIADRLKDVADALRGIHADIGRVAR